jgi:hypothetical protein
MPKRERGTPTVLIADPLEETRMLLMQYVAIEWPDAEIVETGDLANEGVEGFDLVVAGVRPGCGVDTGWLQQVRARASGPSVVALVEGDPGAAQSLL